MKIYDRESSSQMPLLQAGTAEDVRHLPLVRQGAVKYKKTGTAIRPGTFYAISRVSFLPPRMWKCRCFTV